MRSALPFGALLTLMVVATAAPPAAADLLPTCDQPSSLITCDAVDVGKPCQGGGMCYAMPCANIGAANGMVYRCDACPTVLPLPDGGCSPSNLGTPCSDGGTCSGVNGYCGATTKFVCSIPAAARPTGPPAGETGGSGGGSGGSSAGAGSAGSTGTGNAGSTGTGTAGSSARAGSGGGAGTSTTTSGGSGGCDVSSPAPGAGLIAVVLLGAGVVFLLIARRRRSR